ncbi:MAG: hypothetical protein E7619_06505 [Ruminococcaceae bacterium]|nr:hypothetical protein [Oscillospiraceae bacterium]
MKRIFCTLLLALLVVIFSSCTDDSGFEGAVTSGTDDTSSASSLSICGVDISEFSIVYKSGCENGEDEHAARVAEHIKDYFGVDLPVNDDTAPKAAHEILIGRSKHVDSDMRASAILLDNYKLDHANSMLFTVSGHLWVVCDTLHNTEIAVNRLISEITPKAEGDSVMINYSKGLNVSSDTLGEELRIMSYNVQTGTAEKVIPRVSKVKKHITDFGADIIGTQEINYIWLEELEKQGFFDIYTRVGEARQGDMKTAGNEYSCIFFKTDKFDLIDSGTYWLSDTPDSVSKLSDCDYYRIMTFALLERKSDGLRFLHVNTHLEWDHGAVKTNLLQTNIMLELTDELLKNHGDVPVFFTGDFNVGPETEGYARMLEWGNEDSREIAINSSKTSTFSGGSIIDFCFVSKGDFLVNSFSVGNKYEGSDHYPVFVKLYVNK